jgi:hypothetical protein
LTIPRFRESLSDMTYIVKNLQSKTLPELERKINDLTEADPPLHVVSVLAHMRVDRAEGLLTESYWGTTLLLWQDDDAAAEPEEDFDPEGTCIFYEDDVWVFVGERWEPVYIDGRHYPDVGRGIGLKGFEQWIDALLEGEQ